jgi:hypothetical protein
MLATRKLRVLDVLCISNTDLKPPGLVRCTNGYDNPAVANAYTGGLIGKLVPCWYSLAPCVSQFSESGSLTCKRAWAAA